MIGQGLHHFQLREIEMRDEIRVLQLRTRIQELRAAIWPMQDANEVEGLPIYWVENGDAKSYINNWQPVIDEALDLFAPLVDDGEDRAVPTHLEIPLLYTGVERIIINKSKAKESKTFRGIASLLEKCGEFKDFEIAAMKAWLESNDTAALVAHREFVDLRAYIFLKGREGYIRSRFYTHGLLLGVEPGFSILDNRGKVRKERNDTFKDPLAANEDWKVFGKYRK